MMSPEHFLGMTQGFISYTISGFYLLKSLINFLIDVFFYLTDLPEVSDLIRDCTVQNKISGSKTDQN